MKRPKMTASRVTAWRKDREAKAKPKPLKELYRDIKIFYRDGKTMIVRAPQLWTP